MNPAITDPEHTFNYRQLDAASNAIARSLRESGVRPGDRTALLFDQSAWLAAAILGVLKAGGAYVPLDPQRTPDWSRSMLGHAGCERILYAPRHREFAGSLVPNGPMALPVDSRWTEYSGPVVDAAIDPDSTACIYFTSGSSGRPKGVCDSHRNVLHNVLRYTNSLHIAAHDCLSLIQSPVFSGTMSSLFGALLNGASLASFDAQRWGLDGLADWIRMQNVTIFHSVPAIFRKLTRGEARYPRVRLIRLEGDQSTGKDFRLFCRHFPDDSILVNGLGSTECGLVRQYFMDKKSPEPVGVIPLGWPVADMEVLIVNEAGDEIPPGQIGEIAVRSRYLAQGYLNQAELTRERFRESGDLSGARIYRTGDLGALGGDGCLEHRGRKDEQHKIAGQHVDLAAVEAALEEIPGIRDAVAHTRADGSRGPYLAAYLVASGPKRPSLESVTERLAESLPPAMVPARMVWLEAIPLSADGKVDRRSLPEPAAKRPALETPFAAPRDTCEMQLARLWEELLGIRPVGIRDGFFHLGGDSLLAMALADRIQRNFGVSIGIAAIFELPTVEQMAALIAGAKCGYEC